MYDRLRSGLLQLLRQNFKTLQGQVHKDDLNHEESEGTTWSNKVWHLKNSNKSFTIKRSIIDCAYPWQAGSKSCDLSQTTCGCCMAESMHRDIDILSNFVFVIVVHHNNNTELLQNFVQGEELSLWILTSPSRDRAEWLALHPSWGKLNFRRSVHSMWAEDQWQI